MTFEINPDGKTRPSLVPMVRGDRIGLFDRLTAAVRALLPTSNRARPKRRHRSRGSPPLPDWLRRDIGMPPYDEPKRFWDHE